MSLTITIGCPGAGKSTFCDAGLHPTTLRLERDRFRIAIFGSRRAYHESEIDHEVRSSVVTSAMLAAIDWWPRRVWAVTDTGLEHRSIEPFLTAADDHRVPINLWVFDRSLDKLLERNRTRPQPDRIPEDILRQKFDLFNDPKAWWRDDRWITRRRYIG